MKTKCLLIILLIPCALIANDTFFRAQKWTYIGLQLSDTITTLYGINHGAMERNGAVNDIIDKSPVLFVASKVALTCGSLWVFDRLHDRSPILANLAVLLLNSAYGYVQYGNISICLRIK